MLNAVSRPAEQLHAVRLTAAVFLINILHGVTVKSQYKILINMCNFMLGYCNHIYVMQDLKET